jgi:hypothetical protein
MSDRELLEMAAKAAGLFEHKWSDAWKCLGRWTHAKDGWYFEGPAWNPLTDDGDALRLAVKLGIEFQLRCGATWVEWYVANNNVYLHYEPHGSNPYAATRRAIVRAAAELGRAMS